MTPKEDSTKKSSRRTTRIPYSSRRRTSPKKADQNDMSREPSPTVSESAMQEETMPDESATQEEMSMQEESVQIEASVQEEKPLSPKKDEQEETKDLFSSIENKDANSMEVVKEDNIKDADVIKSSEKEKNTSISQASPVKSQNVEYSDVDVPTPMESLDIKNETNLKQGPTVTKSNLEAVENTHIKESENIVSKVQENEKSTIIYDTCNDIDDIKKEDNEIKDENIESVDNDHVVESVNDTKATDIPDPEQQINELLEEDQDIDINENDELKEEKLLEDKDILSTSDKEMDSSIEKKQDEEVYFIH